MKVYVKLYATLANQVSEAVLAHQPEGRGRRDPLTVELPQGSTLADLVAHLELPENQTKIIFVNGRAKETDHVLGSGDEIGMFPPIGGGQVHETTTITLDVWLYGPLARYGGEAAKRSHANPKPTLPAGSRMRDLLAHLNLPTEERGITFINGDLSAMPGLQPDLDHVLNDGDRVAFFHLTSMWPAQYRHGAALAPGLSQAMQEKGLYHHHSGNA
jgi:molybdopterin converting factor small subunit